MPQVSVENSGWVVVTPSSRKGTVRELVCSGSSLASRQAQSGGDARYSSHRDIAQFGRALALGARGRRFKSCYPDGPDGCKHSVPPDGSKRWMNLSCCARLPGCGFESHPLRYGAVAQSAEQGGSLNSRASYGDVAQLVAHLSGRQKVRGSSPLVSTECHKMLQCDRLMAESVHAVVYT